MKPQLVTYVLKEFKIILGAENQFDLLNKAKDNCPDGFKVESYHEVDNLDDADKYIREWNQKQ